MGISVGRARNGECTLIQPLAVRPWSPRARSRAGSGPGGPSRLAGIVGTLLLVAVARVTLLVGLALLALGVPSWLLIWWGLFFLVKAWIAGEKVRDRRTLERLLIGGARAFYAGYGLGWLWLWGHLGG
jgi:hypothetical protein